MTSIGNRAAAAVHAAAIHTAPLSDHAISGPAIAEPTGPPSMFKDTDTAKTRPNRAGSDRLCRSVRKEMSNGVSTSAIATSAAPTTKTDPASGTTAMTAAMAPTDTAITHR